MNTALKSVSTLTPMYEAYLRAGFVLVPITEGKGPKTAGWNKREKCVSRVDQLDTSVGYGIAHAYSSTMALDIDHYESAAGLLRDTGIELDDLIRATDSVMINSGNPGHYKLLYRVPFGLTLPSKKISYLSLDGLKQVSYELRCATTNGLTTQCVLPSAVNHPLTGRPYSWAGNGHFSKLPIIPTELLSLWQSLVNQDAERTIPTDTIAASWDDIQAALDCIPADCARDQWLTVAMALHHSGTQVNQLDQAMSIFHTWSATAQTKYKGPRDIEIVWRSFKADSGIKTGSLFHIAHEYGYKRPMPDVTELFKAIVPKAPEYVSSSIKIPPPEMPMDVWPDVLKNAAIEISESVGCDPLVPLFAGIATLCGAVDSRMRLELMPRYQVPPILWCMTIGDPADKKTPGARAMMAVLGQLEAEDRPRYKRQLLEWEAMDSVHQQSRKAYILSAGQNTGTILTGKLDNDTLPPVAPEPPPKPVDLRLVVQDVTSQKLVRLVADRPRGVLCHLDEMKSWVEKLTDPRSGEDRSTWTKSYESDSYVMDRVGAETSIYAQNMAVSIYGNIQPAVFRDKLRQMSSDGLLQRFIPTALRPEYTKRGEPVPEMFSVIPAWEMKIRELYTLPAVTYTLDQQSYEEFRNFQLWYEQTKQDERLLNADPVYMQAFGKLEGTCGRLILILHLLENPYAQAVSLATTKRAIKLVRHYVVPAYRYTLGDTGGLAEGGIEQWLSDYIVQISGVHPTMTMGDLRKAARRQLDNVHRTMHNVVLCDAMEAIEQAGWATVINDHKDKKTWAINPTIGNHYEQHRLAVIKAKQRKFDESRAIVLGAGKYTERRFVKGYDPTTME